MDVNPELESFREQWRAEVRARNPVASGSTQQSSSNSSGPAKKASAPAPPRPALHLGCGKSKVTDGDDDDGNVPLAFDHPETAEAVGPAKLENAEPVTALDHYERAVEKETLGSLGDSLMLYRKAFRVRFVLALQYCRRADFSWGRWTQRSNKSTGTSTTQKCGPEQPSLPNPYWLHKILFQLLPKASS